MDDFDFDQWKALAQADPEAFEARRQALMSIEFARAGVAGTQAHRLLDQFEAEAALHPPGERLSLACKYMAASAAQLGDWMTQLQRALPEAVSGHPAQAGRGEPARR